MLIGELVCLLRFQGQRFSVGSGSTYAYGVLDRGYKWDLTQEEACELGRRSIYHATYRDAASGGTVSGKFYREGSTNERSQRGMAVCGVARANYDIMSVSFCFASVPHHQGWLDEGLWRRRRGAPLQVLP